jgi:hypothetical protein
MELTDEQKHVLRHSLGLDGRTDKPHRNYYAANEGHEECEALTEMGLMKYVGSPGWTTLHYYKVTMDGMKLLGVDLADVE